MATRIKDIIKYYIRHNVSDKLKERVLDRVSNTWDDGETNEVLRDLWNQTDSAYMEEEEISTAYKRIFETKDTKEKTEMKTHRILYITRVAAVVVPLLILIISVNYTFRRVSNSKKLRRQRFFRNKPTMRKQKMWYLQMEPR